MCCWSSRGRCSPAEVFPPVQVAHGLVRQPHVPLPVAAHVVVHAAQEQLRGWDGHCYSVARSRQLSQLQGADPSLVRCRPLKDGECPFFITTLSMSDTLKSSRSCARFSKKRFALSWSDSAEARPSHRALPRSDTLKASRSRA